MILDNIINRLQALATIIGSDETQQRISTAAAFVVLAQMKRRIFVDGLATDGSQIGQYSTNPYYQNPTKLIGVAGSNVKPAGKNGLATFKNGKAKKTKYLNQGYKELRDLTGRQSNFVDLNFSGSTQGSLQVGFRGNTAIIGFINQESADIIEKNEIRFGKQIIAPTDDEREAGAKAVRVEIEYILNELL